MVQRPNPRGTRGLPLGKAGAEARLRLVDAGGPAAESTTPLPADALEREADGNDAVVASASTPPPAPATKSKAAPGWREGPLATLPDDQLVSLGCRGDTRALETLYRRHAAFAIDLAARIEGSSRDVEDIAHDAFLKAFERLGDLTDRNAFRAWLGAIVVHAVRSRMRRARLLNVLGLGRASEPVDLDAIASPDASPHVRAQIAQIYALLRTLPSDDRIAWTLRAIEGHDLETTARLTDCSLATVKRRISRAQKYLDDHFVDADGESPQDIEGGRGSKDDGASEREGKGREVKS